MYALALLKKTKQMCLHSVVSHSFHTLCKEIERKLFYVITLRELLLHITIIINEFYHNINVIKKLMLFK